VFPLPKGYGDAPDCWLHVHLHFLFSLSKSTKQQWRLKENLIQAKFHLLKKTCG